MTKSKKLYSDKISKFTIRVNTASENKVINRIAAIYKHIFIDEVQDLAGYDLEIVKELFKSDANVFLVGDPRQVTYTTHFPDINKSYKNGRILEFITDKCKSLECDLDTSTLNKSYRNWPELCILSSKLYSALPVPDSNKSIGINNMYFLDRNTLASYLKKKQAVQLRLRRTSSGPISGYRTHNFGDSKGLTFDNLVLFPTDTMKLWLKSETSPLTDLTRAQLYVGLTRASDSLGIFLDGESPSDYPFLSVWSNS